MTEPSPVQKTFSAQLALKVVAWTIAAILTLIVVGAILLFVTAEIDAGVHCAKATFHSAECKDIRTVQAAMIVFGGAAAVPLAILIFIVLKTRKRSN